MNMGLDEWAPKQDDDEFCSNIIHRCVIDENRYTAKLHSAADEVSYFHYKNFAQVDNILHGYAPRRGFDLPEANKTYETNSHYDKELVQQVVRRCGTRIHEHFIHQQYIYQQCASAFPKEIDFIPSY